MIHQSALIAAAADRKHRPASHPVYGGVAIAHPPAVGEWSGWRIRARRQMLGMSQQALADAIGVSRPAVAQWELDLYRPTAEHVERLQAVLG